MHFDVELGCFSAVLLCDYFCLLTFVPEDDIWIYRNVVNVNMNCSVFVLFFNFLITIWPKTNVIYDHVFGQPGHINPCNQVRSATFHSMGGNWTFYYMYPLGWQSRSNFMKQPGPCAPSVLAMTISMAIWLMLMMYMSCFTFGRELLRIIVEAIS